MKKSPQAGPYPDGVAKPSPGETRRASGEETQTTGCATVQRARTESACAWVNRRGGGTGVGAGLATTGCVGAETGDVDAGAGATRAGGAAVGATSTGVAVADAAVAAAPAAFVCFSVLASASARALAPSRALCLTLPGGTMVVPSSSLTPAGAAAGGALGEVTLPPCPAVRCARRTESARALRERASTPPCARAIDAAAVAATRNTATSDRVRRRSARSEKRRRGRRVMA